MPSATRRLVLGSSSTVALLVAAALAWWLTVDQTAGMPASPGTMGRGLAGFVAVWTVMMAAMMLPSVTPVTALYLRRLAATSNGLVRGGRTTALVLGYLLVWAAIGVPAYALALGGAELADSAPAAAPWVGAGALVLAGLYQATPLKDVCLSHCRSPVTFLLHFGQFSGRLKDARVGAYHGGFCVGCCWGLMLVLVAAGVMNLVWMVGIAGIVVVEKLWTNGKRFSLVVGVALVGIAFFVPAHPGLLPGLHTSAM